MARAHVLVTGAAGLIGAAACRRLSGEGVPFTAVWHTVKPGVSCKVRADLSRPEALAEITEVTAVVHAAATLPSRLTDSDREAALNRRIDDHVLARARAWRATVVYVSGTSLYPPHGQAPLDETAAIAPLGRYLEEKARTEEIGIRQAEEAGTSFTTLRVSAPYGPGQRTETVIQRYVERAIAGQALEYYGTGSREQDFTWADDVGDAIVLALRGPGGIFNVATGRPVTMRSLAEIVVAAAGLPRSAVRAAEREDPQEGSRARFDVSAAARDLGWTAATPVTVGVARLLESAR